MEPTITAACRAEPTPRHWPSAEGSPRDYVVARCQQRGIPAEGLRLAVRYGQRVSWFHGALLYYLGVRELAGALEAEPDLRPRVDRLKGTTVVVERGSGRLLTAFKERRGVRKVVRTYTSRVWCRDKSTTGPVSDLRLLSAQDECHEGH